MNELISVIVPVYNAEKYLDRCINSIIKQTYENIELILIDDGSTDQSYAICLGWEEKDCRVKVYHQKNSGVSAARNRALLSVQGRYIAFVDADDYLEPNYCEKMGGIIQESNADVVFCEHHQIFEDGSNVISGGNSGRVEKISSKEFEYYGKRERRAVWGAIYKVDILGKLKFPEDIAIGEDALFLAMVVKQANTIAYYDNSMYNYVIQKESAYYGKFTEKKNTEIDAWLQICKVFDWDSVTRLSAEAMCAETAACMLGRYAGDAGFESKYINRLVHVYRSKLPRLIQYDQQKKRKTFKHILYGLFPHIFVKYWGWKNEKKRRNCNVV